MRIRHSLQAGITGVLYGVTAFSLWGLVPIYYKALGHVSSLEIVAHRVLWAMANHPRDIGHRPNEQLIMDALVARLAPMADQLGIADTHLSYNCNFL